MTAPPPPIYGVVLAGGRSRRFGREKAGALLNGRSLLEASLAVLSPWCERLAVSARDDGFSAELAGSLGLPRLEDAAGHPDGPLSGVCAGLAWTAAEGMALLATVPCDTPWLPADLVLRLASGLGSAPAVAARTPGRLHPLCALWRTELAEPLARLLSDGHPRAEDALRRLGGGEVAFDDEQAFYNVNRVVDLDAAEGMKR